MKVCLCGDGQLFKAADPISGISIDVFLSSHPHCTMTIDPSSLYPTPCPFCAIASSNPRSTSVVPSPNSISPLTHLILSTPHLIAFLDHAPISRGHVLIATRQHREKLSDVTVREGRELGAWLGIVSRAVVRVVDPSARAVERKGEEGMGESMGEGMGDWNVVQNNGTWY